MKFWQRRTAIKILMIVIFLGILTIAILSFFTRKESLQISKDFKLSSKQAYGKGLSFVEYRGDKKIYSVSIDSFSVEKAKLGPFAIGPLNIAHLNKVIVDLYIDELESMKNQSVEGKGMEPPLDFQTPLSSIKKNIPIRVKKIRGLKINDITINLWKGGQRKFKVSSKNATVDRSSGDLIFEGEATMDSGENGNLISHRIRWDRKTHMFKVIDPYIFTKNGKKVEGEEVETDYLFKRVNYQVSNK